MKKKPVLPTIYLILLLLTTLMLSPSCVDKDTTQEKEEEIQRLREELEAKEKEIETLRKQLEEIEKKVCTAEEETREEKPVTTVVTKEEKPGETPVGKAEPRLSKVVEPAKPGGKTWFIWSIDLDKDLNLAAIQLVAARRGKVVTRVDNPLEFALHGAWASGDTWVQVYRDGLVVIHFTSSKGPVYPTHPICSFFTDDFPETVEILTASKQFETHETHRIANLENWGIWAVEPGIWTFWVGTASFQLKEKPNYFYSSPGKLNGVQHLSEENIASAARVGENFLYQTIVGCVALDAPVENLRGGDKHVVITTRSIQELWEERE